MRRPTLARAQMAAKTKCEWAIAWPSQFRLSVCGHDARLMRQTVMALLDGLFTCTSAAKTPSSNQAARQVIATLRHATLGAVSTEPALTNTPPSCSMQKNPGSTREPGLRTRMAWEGATALVQPGRRLRRGCVSSARAM